MFQMKRNVLFNLTRRIYMKMSVTKLVLLLIFVMFCENVLGINKTFQRSSILYGLASEAEVIIRKNASENLCYEQLTELYDAVKLKRVWAYKMLDVSGKPTTGFLGGNNGWTGQSITCVELTDRSPLEVYHAKTVQFVTEYDYPPFNVWYISVFMRHDNPNQLKTNTPNQNLINLGLCIPASCSKEDIQSPLENFLQKKLLTFQKLYDINFQIESFKSPDPTSSWLTKNPRNIAILSVIIAIIIFVAGASYYHLNVYEDKSKINIKTLANIQENISAKEDEISSEIEINKAPSVFHKIILCFSWGNTYKLVSKSEVPENIGAINGMMFFTMLGISVYHFLVYGAPYTRSLASDFRKYEGFFWQIVVNSSFSIDSYLFLSGCLVSYNFYNTKSKYLLQTGLFYKVFTMFKIIAEKLFKSIPVYTMWLLWSIYIFSYLDSRWSTYLREKAHEACLKTWWQNLLFINNLRPLHDCDTCMSWTWLMAAEMQYFILNILLMTVSLYSLKLSIGLIVSMIFYCIYSTGVAAYNIAYRHTLDQQIAQLEQIYHLPWHRIGPYAVGMLTGILLYKLNGKLLIKKRFIWLTWSIAPLINLYLIFGLYGIKPSIEFSSVYISVGRTAWAVGLAWILIACSTRKAGFINTVLSYEGFKIFPRLSNSSYILTVLTIYFICVTYETTIYLSTLSYISQVCSFALFPYLVTIIFTMFYEIPFELLWNIFCK